MKWEKISLEHFVDFFNGKSIKPNGIGEYPAFGSNGLIGYSDKFLYTEGVVLGRVGAYCGAVEISKTNFWASDNTIVVKPKENADLHYVYYLLKNFPLNNFAGGSAQPLITQTVLKSLSFRIPVILCQRKIASILSAYDDLIENNLKRIKLLEEKAFLRYKEIVREEKIEILKLNEVTQVLKRGISPKYVTDDGIVVLNQKCIRNHIVSFEDARLTDSEKKPSEERMLQKFDTLINSTGTGTLGRIAMNIQDEIPLTVDSHVTIVRANERITPIFLCASMFSLEHVIESMGEGSTNQTELSARKLGGEIKISIPSKEIMYDFESFSRQIFNLIWNLQKQNTKLREARDILLPRLMSGEIEV